MKRPIVLRSLSIYIAFASGVFGFQTLPSQGMSTLNKLPRSSKLFRKLDDVSISKKDEDYLRRSNRNRSHTSLRGSSDGTSSQRSKQKPNAVQLLVGRPNGIRRKAARSISNLMASLPRNSSADEGDSTLTKISILEQENQILKQTIKELERENDALERSHRRQRIILENFEGDDEIDWWDEELQESAQNRSYADSTSLQEDDTCIEFEDGACPIEPDVSFTDALQDRAYWLVGLLTLQSMSGLILAKNEALLQTHPFIVYFLTMLVGAGGNAGNQAAVRVIRGIALGTLNERTQRQFLNREFKMALCLSTILSLAGFIRAIIFRTPFAETIAVTAALALIVFTSICFGAILPLILRKIDVDPAHSSTTIQVIMDILGVVMTVFVSTLVLDSPMGQLFINKLAGVESGK